MIAKNFIEKLSFSLTFLQNTCKCGIFFVSLHGYLGEENVEQVYVMRHMSRGTICTPPEKK